MTGQTRTRRALRLTVRVLAGAAIALVLLVVLLAVTLGGPNEREADLLGEALDIRPGMTVAEVGAGDGWLTVETAKRVGPAGRVYATEVEDWQLEEIRAAARDAGVSNVTVLQAGERSTNLPPACCDAIFMRRVYHHLSDPGSVMTDVGRALKPSGRVAVIEFGAGSVIGAVTREGVDSADLVRQVTDSGLEAVTVDDWPGLGHYVAVFQQPSP